VLRRHPRVLIATDDMYEHILLNDTPFTNILNACPDLRDRTLVLNGVSKAYSMTGWRIGYAAGPEAIMRAMDQHPVAKSPPTRPRFRRSPPKRR
jgi:aspartate aminotransferase